MWLMSCGGNERKQGALAHRATRDRVEAFPVAVASLRPRFRPELLLPKPEPWLLLLLLLLLLLSSA
jgi:hypothetical protein